MQTLPTSPSPATVNAKVIARGVVAVADRTHITATNHLNVLHATAAKHRLESSEHALSRTSTNQAHARLVDLPARHGYTKQEESLSRNLQRVLAIETTGALINICVVVCSFFFALNARCLPGITMSLCCLCWRGTLPACAERKQPCLGHGSTFFAVVSTSWARRLMSKNKRT